MSNECRSTSWRPWLALALASAVSHAAAAADPIITITNKNYPSGPDAWCIHHYKNCTADNGPCPEFNIAIEFSFGSGDSGQNITKAEVQLTEDDEWTEFAVDDIPGTTGAGAYDISETLDCGTCLHLVNPGAKIRITRADGVTATAEVAVLLCCTKSSPSPRFVPVLPDGFEDWCTSPSSQSVPVTMNFALMNSDTVEHTYDLDVSGSQPWALEPPVLDPVTVAPGQSGSVDLVAIIPAHMPPGASNLVTIIATAQDDPAVTATASASVGVCGPSALVLEGDPVAGVGLITSISNIAINNNGLWLVEADTDHADTDADSVLLRDGVLALREGELLVAPAGAGIGSFDSVTINDAGNSGYNFFLDGTKSGNDDSGVYLGVAPGTAATTPLVVQESAEAPGFTPGTPFIGFFDVKINTLDQLFVVASIDDPNIASSVDRALYVLETDPDLGGITSFTVLAAEGDFLPGQTEPVADFGTGPHDSAFSSFGALYRADLAGDTTVDQVLYRHDLTADGEDPQQILAQEGGPSPIKGRNWSSLGSAKVDLNNSGGYVFTGSLDGDAATNLVIVRNGAVFVQEGDAVPGLTTGTFLLTSFGTGPVHISDSGDVLWYGDWDDPNTDIDTGLFVNDELIVQEGVTTVDGIVIDTLRGIEDGYHMSNDGHWIIFEAILVDGREGAFAVEYGAAVTCAYDLDDDGEVGPADLAILLSDWNSPYGPAELAELLAGWGPCPG